MASPGEELLCVAFVVTEIGLTRNVGQVAAPGDAE